MMRWRGDSIYGEIQQGDVEEDRNHLDDTHTHTHTHTQTHTYIYIHIQVNKKLGNLKCNIGMHKNEQRQDWDTDAMYINIPFSTLMYIACLCSNLVSVHFYASLYYTSNFLNFLFTCLLSFFYYCKQ